MDVVLKGTTFTLNSGPKDFIGLSNANNLLNTIINELDYFPGHFSKTLNNTNSWLNKDDLNNLKTIFID